MTTPGGAGTALTESTVTSSVLGAPASIIGSELVVQLGSDSSLCPDPMLQGVSYVQASVVYIRNLISDGVSIPSLAVLGLSGRGYALFTRVRGMGILRSSHTRSTAKFAKKVVRNTAIE
jgi:hypothetical protein